MSSIEEDNLKIMERYKKIPPSQSYLAGFIDGDGCYFIRKIKNGYQSGISISQCRTNILQIIRYHFGGVINTTINRNKNIINKMDGEYFHKHNIRNEYSLNIRSNEYDKILTYLFGNIVIKQTQYDALYSMNQIKKTNRNDDKNELYNVCVNANKNKTFNNVNLQKINIEYIQGLFDAEGCIFINKSNYNYYISISQKSYPEILHKIQEILSFGKVYNNISYRIYKKEDCLKFIQLVKSGLIVKYNQICIFERLLLSNDISEKNKLFILSNEDKHKIELFGDVNNQNNVGKDMFLETLKLKNIKKLFCKEINLKGVYKEKSENMFGEKNYNFGKKLSEEHCKKISISNRDAKNGISDETIIKIRELISKGEKNINIQKELNLSRHVVSRVKNGEIILRTENKIPIKKMSHEQLCILKRKIMVDEIIIVMEKINNNENLSRILEYISKEREKIGIVNTVTIDIIKNIKKNIKLKKNIIFESELTPEKYIYYKLLLNSSNSIL